ncbi:MAG TPA: sigma factor, partial [Sphingomonadaceae bacterium]|nr:sigma factor [Sphingomonadaceae bacterium]
MPDDSADQGGQDTDLRKSADRELTELIRALRRYARALVGDDADADDLVQESLKRALTYFDS